MKLTKKQKKDIWQVYDTWLDSYLNGDVATYDKYLDKDYHFIGSTDNEEFLSKKDTTNFFKATADQLAGKTELRNETKIIEKFEELVFVTHLFDAWFLNKNDWSYYGRFRFTNALKKNKEGWRFIYQHFSTTDSKTDEGETIGFDKVNAENIELKNAIKRRTFELEQKNRELEVETALERIRAQAVAMKASSDLLDIVVTMRNEFIKLGHEAHYFWHMMWLPETYEKAMTSGDGSKIGFVMTLPRHIHGDIPLLAKWEKSKKQTVVYAMNVDEALAYVDKMVKLGDFQNIDPQAPTEEDVRHIDGLTFIMARTSHGEIGYSLPGVVKNPPKEDLDILVRFAGAFDLAHQRFLDLQIAEAQARETQIELALEKVRSRTMAMQHSDELQETSFLLDEQVRALGINTWGCAFNIYGEKDSTEWFGNEAGVLPTYTVPHKGIFKEYYQKGQKGESLIIKEFSGQACVDHYEYMSSLPVIGEVLKNLKKTNKGFPTYQLDHVVYFKYGYLLFITKEPVPDAYDVFKRFAKVFEQTYTRFLDLQKAEAQAKEAQIEAVLEKVRSRSLAMHKSEELNDVVSVIFEKLKELDIPATAVGLGIYIDGSKDLDSFVCGENKEGLVITNYRLPYFNNKISKDLCNAKEKQLDLFVGQYSKQVKNNFYQYILDRTPEFKQLPKDIKQMIFDSQSYTITMVVAKHALFNINDFEGKTLSEEDITIIKRFAKVFDQTYTRFLDLKKAEAQAKEAQIEAALERVRSRSMAMHNSEELKEVIKVLYDQFLQLNINIEHAGFILDYKENDDMHIWLADQHAVFPEITLPYFDSAHWNSFNKAKKKGQNFFVNQLDFEEKNKFYKDLFEFIPDLPEETKATYFGFDGLAISTVLLENIGLYIENYSGTPFSDDENKILMRFGKVFQQTYTRFLDLEKAETQTRNSQINLAVERVRAKALAMHKSEEIMEVVAKLKDEVMGLDIPDVIAATIFLSEGENKVRMWDLSSLEKLDGVYQSPLDITFKLKKKDPYLYPKRVWENPDNYFVEVQDTKGFKRIIAWLREHDKNEVADETEAFIETTQLKQLYHAAKKLNNGKLVIDLLDPPSQEMETILSKMGAAFDLAYKRFEDLQKAEAQTKEAQIEAALERTRTQSMLMQHSDELNVTTQVFHEQLQLLGIDSEFSYLWLPDETEKSHMFWATWSETKKGKTTFNNKTVSFPLDKKEPSIAACYTAWASEETVHVNTVKPNEVKDYFDTWNELLSGVTKFKPKLFPDGLYYIDAYMKYGCFGIMIKQLLTKNEEHILSRFSKEFERTYSRFLGLQKAEAQAREAQIETALEKVRSRTMAMQKGEELQDVVVLLYKELIALGVTNFATCGYVEINEKTNRQATWVTNPGGDSLGLFHLPLTGDVHFDARYDAWKKQQTVFHQTVAGKERRRHLEYAITTFNSKEAEEMVRNQFPDPTVFYCFNFSHGYLHLVAGSQLTQDEETLLARFTKVFEQTYARFLDLKKAEAQAREAQIEAALEKVRSRSLAMHKPDELQEVIAVVAEKLKDLGVIFDAGGVILCTYFPDNKDVMHWIAADDFSYSGNYLVPYFDNPIFNDSWDSKIRGDDYFSKEFPFEVKNSFFTHCFEHSDYKNFPDEFKQHALQAEKHHLSAAWSKNSAIIIPSLTGVIPSESDADIMKRFAKVFEQAYIRFMDLQKAEAQAREAQIETALEKVRSRTMAMQKSEELPEAANNLFLQVQELGIPAWSAGYCIWDKDKKNATANMSSEGVIQKPFVLPNVGVGYNFQKPLEKGETFHVGELGGKTIVKHYEFMRTLPIFGEVIDGIIEAGFPLPTFQIFHIVYFEYGYVMFITYEAVPDSHDIFKRFGKVFEQTYIRFLDLQRAEAQAREAQIEAALERVRSQSMGMQSTNDFAQVTTEMFNQLRNFGEDLFATGIVFCDKHKGHVEQWHSIPGGGMLSPMIVPVDLDYIHQYRYNQWKKGTELFSIEIPSDFIEQHFEDIFKLPSAQITLKDLESRNAPMPETPSWEIDYGASFKNGYILASSLKPLENMDILPRFAKVFEQAYTRYLDLQMAEKNAYKSKVEAALERVRAKALAMQEPEELKEVANVLRTEMGLLGIEELETSSIYILDKHSDTAECWYALKDASSKKKKLISDHLSMDFNKTWVGRQMLKFHESKKETTSIVMQGNQRLEWVRYCESNSQVLRGYYGKEIPERTYHLNKFSHGAIGAASAGDISEESWALLKRSAAVFSLAYSRFKDLTQAKIDLKKLKTEKKRAEEALSELQTTQKQLIQSEKMASLGELTAGIAHEIQNPLNFVNNFSEVSKELLEEMQEEIDAGNFEEVKAIMDDVVQNLEKINHHGKRADDIVKGMLQHSRASGDKKEPVDLNSLADEYLRLAYHGLRAKDKSFNAELISDFDTSLENVMAIPQDIGRVILNLLTNAFYVVNEKKKMAIEGYKPTVSISTKKKAKVVEIIVTDNGNGMPDAVKEKIFQPFFTTKPTGQGTGLGLSMSYDIITKGHNGNLKVKTKQGEGTTFTIELPNE